MSVNKGELQPLNNLFLADMGIQNLLMRMNNKLPTTTEIKTLSGK